LATGKITKEAIDALKAGNRDAYLWDRQLAGFGVKVTPAGRKVYVLQYRLGGRAGGTKRLTLGVHGALTPDRARRRAQQAAGEIAEGVDVAVVRRRQRHEAQTAPTVAKAAGEFTELHCRTKPKPRSFEEYDRAIRLFIAPALASSKLADVSHADVERLHHSLRATPVQANRIVKVLSKLMTWAIKRGYRPDRSNPVRGLERFKERSRERFLSVAELAALGEAISQALANGSLSPWAAGAIRLLVFTGARLSEILTLRWDYVDLGAGVLRLPDSKSDAKTIMLNAPAEAVLAELPRTPGNPFVICGDKSGAHLVNLQKAWRRVRKAAGLDDVRLHDLRHTNASLGVASGLSLPLIGGLLGHRHAATTQRYAHLYHDPMREAAERIGERASRAMRPSVADPNEGVVGLRKR
jgi:integrase